MKTETVSWFNREEDWVLKRSIIFNKNLVRLTFLEVDRIVKLVGGKEGIRNVLDLCCGIGRHSIEFARHGFNVTGVDITKPYLAIAEEKAKSHGLDIEFVCSDMKVFSRPGSFDLVANLCTSFGYLEDVKDDIQVLQNLFVSLRKDGKCIIEILGKEVIASTFRPTEELFFEDCQVKATSRIINDWGTLECRRLVIADGKETEIVAYHRLYSATELKGHLQSVGFRNIQIYGSFAGTPYDHTAKSMVVVCQK